MDYTRCFPRYNTFHLNGQVKITGIEADVIVKDISLGGLQVQTKNKLIIKDFNKVIITFNESNIYELFIKEVWTDQVDTGKEKVYRIGFQLKFLDITNFNRWMTFLKALHIVRQKKRNTKS